MSDTQKLKAAILAGGYGTRLRSVVSDRPKVLADVCNKPFITFLLDQLISAKIGSAVLCIGYLGEKIRHALGHKYRSLDLEFSQEPEPLGTAGALRRALPYLESHSVLVMNGDSYVEANLGDLCHWHIAKNGQISMLLTHVLDTGRYGRVQVEADGKIHCFDEKKEAAVSGWINAGIYLIENKVIQSIPAHRFVSLEQEIIPDMIGKGLYGFKSKGRFIDIGTPASYAEAPKIFKQYP